MIKSLFLFLLLMITIMTTQNVLGKLDCYEAGERDGENARFDQDSYDECNIQGENHYENGFEYGCESQRSVQDCNIIRLSE